MNENLPKKNPNNRYKSFADLIYNSNQNADMHHAAFAEASQVDYTLPPDINHFLTR